MVTTYLVVRTVIDKQAELMKRKMHSFITIYSMLCTVLSFLFADSEIRDSSTFCLRLHVWSCSRWNECSSRTTHPNHFSHSFL